MGLKRRILKLVGITDPNDYDNIVNYEILRDDFNLMAAAVKAFKGNPAEIFLRVNGVVQKTYVTWTKWSTDLKPRWDNFCNSEGRNPAFIYINNPITKSAWHLAVEQHIGVYINFTQAYANIKGRGWIDYESLKYTLQQSFDEIKAKQPLNCSNWSLILYCIAKDLKIYDVHFQHVECATSGGHIRLVIMGGEFPTVTIGNYSQYTRVDGASRADVNDEYPIGTVWCPNGTILSYDDQWLMAGVNFNLPL
jgi:hypothetical protein